MVDRQISRHQKMLEILYEQPYTTNIDDIEVRIDYDVFPSDKGFTTKDLIQIINNKQGKVGLDMGCGCGILALAMLRSGFDYIYAIDRHKPAVECTRRNIKHYSAEQYIQALYGDLFQPISKEKITFDLILFNYPCWPTQGEPVFGYDPDGGRYLIERFFSEAKFYMNQNSKIILPFTEISGSKHDPFSLAVNYNYSARTLLQYKDQDQIFHYIYELSR